MVKTLPKSKLVKSQSRSFSKVIDYYDEPADMIVTIRHDDRCGNGHNTFSVTADIYKLGKRNDRSHLACGCLHDEIAKQFPELAPLIKWHICSTDGPMHYIANSLYHASNKDCWGKPGNKDPDLEAARSSAIWPDAELQDFTAAKLSERLAGLLADFENAVKSLGFEY